MAQPICDECGSSFTAAASAMPALCAECAHKLYGYPACEHHWVVDEEGARRCARCGWNGHVSKYLRSLKR